ncbi:hypothetical protein [Alkalimarinus coralli]|uniref:hypothetical protein n=1 Tax=Alkalimarinus coralli TaxID=2935863 RepID=UPI00202B1EF8|nr:hypothetical protein [Alkalimarinus coralli]
MGGPFIVYFTGYLATIPFGHAPNYVFTLKPSPQLEMELNHLLGDDTIEYTPFDYSLDEQEITYVTNGVDSMILNMIERPKRSPETIVTLSERDLEYVTSIRTLTPFKFEIVEKTCYLSANTYDLKPHTIGHPDFKTPIRIKPGEKGSMNVSVEGVFEVKHGSCNEVPGYSQEYDPVKEIALEAYFRYPYTYSDIFKYRVEKRPTFTMTIARFDWFISNF